MTNTRKDTHPAKSHPTADRGRKQQPPSPIVDLPESARSGPTNQPIEIPPPSVQIVEIEIEVGGSIRITLEAKTAATRKFSALGSTLSATVISDGTPYAGTLDEADMTTLLDQLGDGSESQTLTAVAIIELLAPGNEHPRDNLRYTYEMVQVAGELLCLEHSESDDTDTYVGTQNLMVTAYNQPTGVPTVHSSSQGRS